MLIPIDITLVGIVTDINCSQDSNADIAMEVTLEGMTIDDNLLSWNAYNWIEVTVVGIVIVEIGQPKYRAILILIVPVATVTDVNVWSVYRFIPETLYVKSSISRWQPDRDDSSDNDDGATILVRLLHPATKLIPI